MFKIFNGISLLGVYLSAILLVLLALAFGYLIGRYMRRHHSRGDDASLGSAVAATLGLLAFMLALTFNMTAERFAHRKALLLEEVNAIGTTFLRADFLQEKARQQAHALLVEYATLRSHDPATITAEDFRVAIARSDEIHSALWQLVEQGLQDNDSELRLKAFYEPLNQVIDLHTMRLQVGAEYQIPTPIWMALYTITALAVFGIGVQLGLNARGSIPVALSMSLAFALVILMIADLDRANEGLLLVDQGPMQALAEKLRVSD
ncbi:hypothetical protein M0G74_11295 [Microbulbifer sp. CAU 1566]|uniref:bestrophin-like domain n=1 Tax=Microbulbifer sp. CAU 1566 TaxID=2933269 RepID=UPI002003EDBC|nr:hypothetical protein [Microbulbifer sp. CAU 1566]MCK7597856.1 hypothetical protein [Microbulbifer sp. CAU 1566]